MLGDPLFEIAIALESAIANFPAGHPKVRYQTNAILISHQALVKPVSRPQCIDPGRKEPEMQIAMVGLGRMGANMVLRLMQGGHEFVVYDHNPDAVRELVEKGAIGSSSVEEMASRLAAPRAVWLMAPAGVVDDAVQSLRPHLQANDIRVDGGNSHYLDDLRRARSVVESGLRWVDVGVSGGISDWRVATA